MSNLIDSYKKSINTGQNHRDVFDWSSPSQVIDKVIEEANELKEALESKKSNPTSQSDTDVFSELSDLSFALVQVLRHLNTDLEDCLNFSNEKFKIRFNEMLEISKLKNTDLKELTSKELESLWALSKKNTKNTVNKLAKQFVLKTKL